MSRIRFYMDAYRHTVGSIGSYPDAHQFYLHPDDIIVAQSGNLYVLKCTRSAYAKTRKAINLLIDCVVIGSSDKRIMVRNPDILAYWIKQREGCDLETLEHEYVFTSKMLPFNRNRHLPRVRTGNDLHE